MKSFILIFNIILCPLMAWSALVEPQVINTSTQAKVIMGPSVSAAIQRVDKNFIPLETRHFKQPIPGIFMGYDNELPMAVSGDFNGDKVKDLVVMGLTKRGKSVIVQSYVVTSQPGKGRYKVIPHETRATRYRSLKQAHKRLHSLDIYLGLTTKNERNRSTLPSNRDSFKLEVFEGITVPKYVDKGILKTAVPIEEPEVNIYNSFQ